MLVVFEMCCLRLVVVAVVWCRFMFVVVCGRRLLLLFVVPRLMRGPRAKQPVLTSCPSRQSLMFKHTDSVTGSCSDPLILRPSCSCSCSRTLTC